MKIPILWRIERALTKLQNRKPKYVIETKTKFGREVGQAKIISENHICSCGSKKAWKKKNNVICCHCGKVLEWEG